MQRHARIALLLCAGSWACLGFVPAYATTGDEHTQDAPGHSSQPTVAEHVHPLIIHSEKAPQGAGHEPAVGIDENLGGFVPLDLIFRDSQTDHSLESVAVP